MTGPGSRRPRLRADAGKANVPENLLHLSSQDPNRAVTGKERGNATYQDGEFSRARKPAVPKTFIRSRPQSIIHRAPPAGAKRKTRIPMSGASSACRLKNQSRAWDVLSDPCSTRQNRKKANARGGETSLAGPSAPPPDRR